MPLHGKFLIILIGEILLIFSYQSMAIAFLAITSNMRLSLSLGSAYAMLALTYSGLTFPVFGMSVFSQAFAGIFPFTYWNRLLISQSLRGEPAGHVVVPILFLLGFISFGLLFVPLLQKTLLNRKRWGKM
jgi:ABC-2 type transport system permease protein